MSGCLCDKVECPECGPRIASRVVDNYDSCLTCGVRIPPGPSFCSTLCERAHDIAQALHDLYGHTFDLLGFEAIKHGLQMYSDEAINYASSLCNEMANRYDQDIEGCNGDELLRYSEGITCASRLAMWIKTKRPLNPLPGDRDFTK